MDSKTGKKKKTFEHGIVDPLSKTQTDVSEAIDPLSMFAAESTTSASSKSSGVSVCILRVDDVTLFYC